VQEAQVLGTRITPTGANPTVRTRAAYASAGPLNCVKDNDKDAHWRMREEANTPLDWIRSRFAKFASQEPWALQADPPDLSPAL